MVTSVRRWFLCTLVVGLLPSIGRFIIWFFSMEPTIAAYSVTDLVSFGFILHISVLNEVHRGTASDESWKFTHFWLSVVSIVLYSFVYISTIQIENGTALDISKVEFVTFVLVFASAFHGYSVLTKLDVEADEQQITEGKA
ncbi:MULTISPECIES: hypothetical protein [Vibrio]|uniref:hypothetical protein n=1 Tax=Vibrio TaxID=662 RepID=UPI001CDCAD4C|nr:MULTISPECIES: hypothetical protein [Vibrio]MCA2483330.1 hypothetical protein [Vibrio alginolyticus]MDW2279635.1 hypothetical protein [Vibrio sp. 1402]